MLLPGLRDGTSQRARRAAALDPAYVPIDERTSGDLLRFVQEYAKQLSLFDHDEAGVIEAGTWSSFASRAGVSIEDMVAYLAEPERFSGERARWLGRPHFALLLTFVELLGHARDHLNGFTRRHLDYYYRDLLEMAPEAPRADRATVLFTLRPGVSETRLPLGTELRAGKDADGTELIYRTERELVVNRAQVAQLRSVLVDRHVLGASSEIRNVYAHEDATQIKGSPTASGWKPFGQPPIAPAPAHPRGAALGWALRSPRLALSEGTRTLTLTLALGRDGGGTVGLLAALGLPADLREGEDLTEALEAALALEVSTAHGWIAPGITAARLATGAPGDDYRSLRGVPGAEDPPWPALQLQVTIGADRDALAPPPGEAPGWPTLRLTLRPRWNLDTKAWQSPIEAFAPLELAAVHLAVEVSGLRSLRLQQEERRLDPRKPFEPFGSRPAVGARLYLEHPELTRARLAWLRFDVEWMGLPAQLERYYKNYPAPLRTRDAFKARVVLVDRNLERTLAEALPLFLPAQALTIPDVAEVADAARGELAPTSEVRQASRHLFLELTPMDFGHDSYAALAAAKARELAVALAKEAATVTAEDYRVDPPYTPRIKQLTAAYAASIELNPASASAVGEHQLLHVHPFGTCRIDAARPSFLPRYDAAGELYLGVRDLAPPQHLALLVQVAEGTSDPDVERPPLSWSYLDGDRFEPLSGAAIQSDTTRGLINSGIVELALPKAASGGRLPPELYWLRVSIPRELRSVCDVVAIRAQAVSVWFDDRGNAASHYAQPLPAGSLRRLAVPAAGIAKIEQPYASSGGRPAEDPERLDTRVSERLRHKNRALTAWDYERLVLHRFPQIGKARCLPAEGGGGGVDVIVIPDVRTLPPGDRLTPRAAADLLAEIRDHLAERAPAAARIRVRNPRYVPVRVRLGVRFRERLDEGEAQRRLNDELVGFLSPWVSDERAQPVIGGRIYATSILDFVDRREYVDYAAAIKLFRSPDGVHVDPASGGDHVAADRLDQVLVAAPTHDLDLIPAAGIPAGSLTGINYLKVQLDFVVE
ncbi:MAG: baseplate J/gp47 family protein [Kofleriaceae bacterium]